MRFRFGACARTYSKIDSKAVVCPAPGFKTRRSTSLHAGRKMESDGPPPAKKAKTSLADSKINTEASLSLSAPISPPRRSRKPSVQEIADPRTTKRTKRPVVRRSPFQLTWIRDLPEQLNIDAVTLKDLLGDPLISECWEFNYLHDIDFLMQHFDEDTKDHVKVHIVHGHWRRSEGVVGAVEVLQEQASRYQNVTTHTAYMPEAYGTHHTKMMVLFRHDETAQIIIHTANMIHQDWTNMTQAVWCSPLLPLLGQSKHCEPSQPALGSGDSFKIDFLNYLKSYNVKRPICRQLVDQLVRYDFSTIRGQLIGSVPGRHSMYSDDSPTTWGWPAVAKALSQVASTSGGNIIAQVSSIATLGVKDVWLDKTLFKAFRSSSNAASNPSYQIVFPTADEIRRSLDGYNSGSSIHVKIQNPQQQKQLEYLKPLLHHWAGDGKQHENDMKPERHAGRKRAAPHIKTYVRLQPGQKKIDWALVTSANLSKQAWGEAVNAAGDVRIQSYELGVLVWPDLFEEGDGVEMVPVFKTDWPETSIDISAVVAEKSAVEIQAEARAARLRRFDNTGLEKAGESTKREAQPPDTGVRQKQTREEKDEKIRIGLRMPYDLPLTKYTSSDEPWCASKSYEEPDWKGQSYIVRAAS